MRVQEIQLREFMLDSGLVTLADIDAAEKTAKSKKTNVGRVLVNEGKISDDDLRRVHGYILGIPFVYLKDQKIEFEVLSLIPEPIARTHNIVAYRKNANSLEVAMLDTQDLSAIDFVSKKTSLRILPRLTDVESMKSVLLQYQKSLKAEFGDIIQKEIGTLTTLVEDGDEKTSETDLKKMAEDLPVVKIVDTLLKHAIIQNASDIHIEPMEHEVLVRYRIDGLLRDAMILPRQAAASISARIKVLSNLKLDEKRLPQDGRFKVEAGGEKVSLRVSILPVYYGEKIVMRLLRDGVAGFTLENLWFHGEGLEHIHRATKLATGLILATGPTGSGKTTTLYTILDILNTPDVNISTIEDPIEYQMKRVNQTQVKPEIGFSFVNGLRSLVRQDPDIIMVGEIRDNETAGLAVNAALTGHLVLSTLHTNSAAGALPRLLDMKVEPFLLVSTLDTIIGQRLVRKLTTTKESYTLSAGEYAELQKLVDMDRLLKIMKDEKAVAASATWKTVEFARPKPTSEIEDGFKGRLAIHEVLKMTATIRELVMQGKTAKEIEEQARKEGMLTMLEDGIYRAAQGLTTIEEVLRVVTE